ncbi:MFS transporter [Thermasporomyces composti]|jgi:predicted MFS family arabinose efflux permease|uniref:Putative MFS family arabinose efflux permease n=1 Tax=Thermasporomyces composti TaxID=696763 RepID=A0A3D9V919_THECX|nr:MFS transporter [Thermasporomyces composti]REF38278.1 putative MFS family arabinose efflux permease [Thermasporomyces composti]
MYRSLLVLALGTFAVGTDSFVVAGVLPEAAAALGVPIGTAGWLITAYAFAYAVGAPVMATVTAGWPTRTVFATGFAAFVIGNMATAAAQDVGLAVTARALAGLGGAIVTPTAVATAAALATDATRGRALATVMGGLSAATALGAPLGTFVGALTGDWRATMGFVSLLGIAAGVGIVVLLPATPRPPAVPLVTRLAPVADGRVGLTLATTLFVYTGLYTVYSFISQSLDRATGGSGAVLAGLLVVWGVASTAGTLVSGGLVDRYGNRRVINTAIAVAAVNFFLLPWTSATLPGAMAALVVWGLTGWGLLAPQTHRLVTVRPSAAPLLSGLASATVYVAVSASGVTGQLGLALVGPYRLGVVGAVLIVLGLVTAEAAHRLISRRTIPRPAPTVDPTLLPADDTTRGER